VRDGRPVTLLALAATLAVAGCARGAGPVIGTATSGTLSTQRDGLELTASFGSAPGASAGATTITVTLRNLRSSDVMYASTDCFAQVSVVAALPLEPTGKTWDGAAGAFKTYALESGLAAGGVPATDPMTIYLAGTGCPSSDSYEAPLGPGESLQATFDWAAEYVPGVAIDSQSASFTITAGYDRQNGPPSYPPDYTGIRGSWFPVFKQITLAGQLQIPAPSRTVLTAGQAIDAALSSPDFRSFVESVPIGSCGGGVNLYLTNNSGGELSAGPAWNVEYICESPRQFRIVAVDPATGDVRGAIACDIPCNR
jgi:hypothetical protein